MPARFQVGDQDRIQAPQWQFGPAVVFLQKTQAGHPCLFQDAPWDLELQLGLNPLTPETKPQKRVHVRPQRWPELA